jgi:hypothetical protein
VTRLRKISWQDVRGASGQELGGLNPKRVVENMPDSGHSAVAKLLRSTLNESIVPKVIRPEGGTNGSAKKAKRR